LLKLEIKCKFDSMGCKETISLEMLEKHSKSCLFNPDKICPECKHKIGIRSDHNCLENMKSYIKSFKVESEYIKNRYYSSEMKLKEAL